MRKNDLNIIFQEILTYNINYVHEFIDYYGNRDFLKENESILKFMVKYKKSYDYEIFDRFKKDYNMERV